MRNVIAPHACTQFDLTPAVCHLCRPEDKIAELAPRSKILRSDRLEPLFNLLPKVRGGAKTWGDVKRPHFV
jgi:hypothetical protein